MDHQRLRPGVGYRHTPLRLPGRPLRHQAHVYRRPGRLRARLTAMRPSAGGLVEYLVARRCTRSPRLLRWRGPTARRRSVPALFGAEFLFPVYLQALRGRTALETGFILLALAITSG